MSSADTVHTHERIEQHMVNYEPTNSSSWTSGCPNGTSLECMPRTRWMPQTRARAASRARLSAPHAPRLSCSSARAVSMRPSRACYRPVLGRSRRGSGSFASRSPGQAIKSVAGLPDDPTDELTLARLGPPVLRTCSRSRRCHHHHVLSHLRRRMPARCRIREPHRAQHAGA